MKDILLSAERDLRATGVLSETTCRAFIQTDEATRRGFEPSFAFLGCSTRGTASDGDAVPTENRIEAIRLMMLRLDVHTDIPRWSSLMLDNLFEAARQLR